MTPVAREVCRGLRKNATPAEKIFWKHVRNRRFLGFKFYRQYPIFLDANGRDTFYVADFYCHELKLVIELDGKVHEKRRGYDRERDELIRAEGICVKRFRNEDVERNSLRVMHELEEFASSKLNRA